MTQPSVGGLISPKREGKGSVLVTRPQGLMVEGGGFPSTIFHLLWAEV